MTSVKTDTEIENSAKRAIEALYGSNIENFKVRVILPYSTQQLIVKGGLPTEPEKDSWDVQVTFLLNNLQYTVDLLIHQEDGQISYARLIDKMTSL
jgi:hypothetical protein